MIDSALAPFMRRYACRVKPEQRSTIFLVRHIFNYKADCRFLQTSDLGGRTHHESCFCPDFLLPLSCTCYLRLSTARHSYLINKLQLIAHAMVERIIRQSSASQLEYVRLVLISATLYTQWIWSIPNWIKWSSSFLANRVLIWNGNEVPEAIPHTLFFHP